MNYSLRRGQRHRGRPLLILPLSRTTEEQAKSYIASVILLFEHSRSWSGNAGEVLEWPQLGGKRTLNPAA
jgi:hypothetical protein